MEKWLIISAFVLGMLSVFDIRYQKIPIDIVWFCSFVMIVCHIVSGDIGLHFILAGAVLFIASMISYFSKGKLGMGDGFVLAFLELSLGVRKMFEVLIIALLICFIVAALLLTIFKKKKDDTLPFIPFLLFGNLVMLL